MLNQLVCRNIALLGCVQGWGARLQLLLMSRAAFFVLHLQASVKLIQRWLVT